MRRLIPALLLLALFLVSPALADGDVLKTFKSRFKSESFLSEREAVIDELAEVGKPKALGALLYCMELSRKEMEKILKQADKLRDQLLPVTKKYQEKYRKYADQQAKQGNPKPKTHPAWPIALELRKLEADGLVVSRVAREEAPDPRRGGRPRVYYRLTGLGEKAALGARSEIGSFYGLVPRPVGG